LKENETGFFLIACVSVLVDQILDFLFGHVTAVFVNLWH